MKQPHTEETIKHTDDQQDTGNHKTQDAPDAAGADRFGGTRAGAETLEGANDHNKGELAGARLGSEDVEQALGDADASPEQTTVAEDVERPV